MYANLVLFHGDAHSGILQDVLMPQSGPYLQGEGCHSPGTFSTPYLPVASEGLWHTAWLSTCPT